MKKKKNPLQPEPAEQTRQAEPEREEDLDAEAYYDEDGEYDEYDPADDARVCSRCGRILLPGKPFCPHCGVPVDVAYENNPTRWEYREKRSGRIRRAAALAGGIVGGAAALAAVVTIAVFAHNTRTVQTGKDAVENAYASFLAETISYKDAVDAITPYLESGHEAVAADAEKLLDRAKEIEESRNNYSLGSTYMIRGEYYNAVKYFSAVSQNDDARYKKSVGHLKRCKRLFRTQAVNQYEKALAKDDIDAAKAILAQLVEIFPDEDFGKRISDIENERLQEEIADAEYWQEVESSRAVTYESGYSQSTRAGMIYVHNYNDSSVRKLQVSVAMFDSDGLPLKNRDGEHIFETAFDDVDIPPGETATFTLRASLPEDCALIKACVISARYADERFWRNPFYDYWVAYRTDVYKTS